MLAHRLLRWTNIKTILLKLQAAHCNNNNIKNTFTCLLFCDAIYGQIIHQHLKHDI